MRLKFNKQIEFFIKKYFFPESFLFKRRLERSIKNKDENEIELLERFIEPGTDSIDVGVYRGVYSYEMSKYSKNVHSFEPNPIIFEYINKNLKKIINNIFLYNYALSNKNEVIDLKVPIRNEKYNRENFEEFYELGRATIHQENTFKRYEKFQITSKKIDEFNFKNNISFIKIDVEGHELEVIKGGEEIISKNKPILLVEIEERHSQSKVSDTINYINKLGYISHYYDNKILKKTSELNNLSLFNNYIFLPE